MDSLIHRFGVRQVLNHPKAPKEQRLALRCFLKCWHAKNTKGSWMRSQIGWKDSATLWASAFSKYPCGQFIYRKGPRLVNGDITIDPFRILMCSYGRKLCERGNYCRRCALDRIDFAWSEFLPAWPRAPHWYAMVLATDQRASHAGVHLGRTSVDPESDSTPVYQPF